VILSLNKPNKTITIHKNNCNIVMGKKNNGQSLANIENQPNGVAIGNNQLWITEENFTTTKAEKFFSSNNYGVIFCEMCF
jgi:hypothetical protein